jgi:hypothetical protein
MPTIPTIGTFYRHYKSKGGNDHVYKIIGLAKHSETDEPLVIYQALYESEWLKGFDFSARPLEMFAGELEVNGNIVKRFTLIPDYQA